MEQDRVSVKKTESVTLRSKENTPAVVGYPISSPVVLTIFNPGGRVPLLI